MSKVFLSHSHADKSFARQLANDLADAGHFVWVDEAEILLGDSLIEKIAEGIRQVDFLAALLSHASVNSSWVKRELEIAINREIADKKIFVLPVLIDDATLPDFLAGKMYADFRSIEQYKAGLSLILRRLEVFDKAGPTFEDRAHKHGKDNTCLNCEFFRFLTLPYCGGWGVCVNEESEYFDMQCVAEGGCSRFQDVHG